MLRITRQDACLVVEGSVAGPWVAELSRAAESLLSDSQSPRLDLSAVNFVDHAGADLLRELDRRMPIHATGFVIQMLRRGM
jgi:ABC-type transporter Mla MlaB component